MRNSFKSRIERVNLFLKTNKIPANHFIDHAFTDAEATEIYSRVFKEAGEKLYIQKGDGFLCIDEIESESEILAVYEGYIKGAIELFVGPVIKNYKEGGFIRNQKD